MIVVIRSGATLTGDQVPGTGYQSAMIVFSCDGAAWSGSRIVEVEPGGA